MATADAVAERWRELTDAEFDLATTLCQDASARIRALYPTAEARLEPELLEMVVASMVKRAMLSVEYEGVSSVTDSAGAFSQSKTFRDAAGNLYLTKDDKALLAEEGAGRVRSVPITSSLTKRVV